MTWVSVWLDVWDVDASLGDCDRDCKVVCVEVGGSMYCWCECPGGGCCLGSSDHDVIQLAAAEGVVVIDLLVCVSLDRIFVGQCKLCTSSSASCDEAGMLIVELAVGASSRVVCGISL